MQRETIRSALLDLLNAGDIEVVDGRIMFHGEPLEEHGPAEYLDNGWSVETSYGCRRHRAIDDYLEKLARGDEAERRVANEADQWFCFSPKESPDLAAADETEAKQAAKAYFNSNLLIRLLGGVSQRDNAMGYRIEADNWEGVESENHWFMPPAHAVVYGVTPESEAPDRWPDEYIADLKGRVEYYRSGRADQDEAWLEG